MWWWKFNHDGPVFEPFGIGQLMVWVCLTLACTGIILFQNYLRREPLARQTIKWLIISTFLLGQLALQLFYITNGIWNTRFSLPLKVSDLAWIAVVIMLITGSRFWTSFAFYAGTSSALLTIIFPDMERYGFPHFRFLHFFYYSRSDCGRRCLSGGGEAYLYLLSLLVCRLGSPECCGRIGIFGKSLFRRQLHVFNGKTSVALPVRFVRPVAVLFNHASGHRTNCISMPVHRIPIRPEKVSRFLIFLCIKRRRPTL